MAKPHTTFFRMITPVLSHTLSLCARYSRSHRPNAGNNETLARHRFTSQPHIPGAVGLRQCPRMPDVDMLCHPNERVKFAATNIGYVLPVHRNIEQLLSQRKDIGMHNEGKCVSAALRNALAGRTENYLPGLRRRWVFSSDRGNCHNRRRRPVGGGRCPPPSWSR